MAPPWKPQNGFHSGLGIAHRTRDSHIPTADRRYQTEDESKEDWTAETDSGRLSARSDEGTPGGKVLKNRGPYLLLTDTQGTRRIPPHVHAVDRVQRHTPSVR